MRVTEMLPAPDRCWLVDRAGASYVSELRFTMLRRDHGDPRRRQDRQDPQEPQDPQE